MVITVKTRMTGGTWTARAGHGKDAKIASCTSSDEQAARHAAAKYFAAKAGGGVHTERDLELVRVADDEKKKLRYGEALFDARLLRNTEAVP